MAGKEWSKQEALSLIEDAHHDALLWCGSPEALKAKTEYLHERIAEALGGEQMSVCLLVLTQAVARLGRKFKQ